MRRAIGSVPVTLEDVERLYMRAVEHQEGGEEEVRISAIGLQSLCATILNKLEWRDGEWVRVCHREHVERHETWGYDG